MLSDTKHLPVLNLLPYSPILIPPWLFPLVTRRESQVNSMLLSLGFGLLLLLDMIPHLVVIKHRHRFNHVRRRYALVFDQEQILRILGIRRRAEVVRASVHPRSGLIVVNHYKLVMHARARATGRFVVKVLGVRNGRVRPVANVETADGFVGQAIHHDILALGFLLDGVADDTRCLVEEGEGVKQAGFGGVDVGGDALEGAFLGAVRGESNLGVDAFKAEVSPL